MGAEGIARLTLEGWLADPALSTLFNNSFCVVASSATVEEARSAMKGIPNCKNIFVTANGSAQEPVIGWLTDVDLRRAGAPMRKRHDPPGWRLALNISRT